MNIFKITFLVLVLLSSGSSYAGNIYQFNFECTGAGEDGNYLIRYNGVFNQELPYEASDMAGKLTIYKEGNSKLIFNNFDVSTHHAALMDDDTAYAFVKLRSSTANFNNMLRVYFLGKRAEDLKKSGLFRAKVSLAYNKIFVLDDSFMCKVNLDL